MYPASLDDTTTHDLLQEVSLDDFRSQNISNEIVYFTDRGERRAPNYKCSIPCIFVFAVHWSAKTQPTSVAHSTD